MKPIGQVLERVISRRPLPSRRTSGRWLIFAVVFALSWNLTGAVYYAEADTDLLASYGSAGTDTGLGCGNQSNATGTVGAAHTVSSSGLCSPVYGSWSQTGTPGACTGGSSVTWVLRIAFDHNDCSYIGAGASGGGSVPTGIFYNADIPGGAATITGARICGVGGDGHPSYAFSTKNGSGTWTVRAVVSAGGSDYCHTVTFGAVTATGVMWTLISAATGGYGFYISSFEAYGSAYASAPLTNYVRGLYVSRQSPTSVVVTWTWALSFTGSTTLSPDTWTYTNGTFVASSMTNGVAGVSAGALCSASGSCAGPWTLTVTDIGRNVQATYTIAGDSGGYLIGDITQPGITGVSGCYNATAAQCGAGQSAGTMNVTYAVKFNPQGTQGTVEIGTEDVNQGSIASSAYVAYGRVTGVYTVTGMAVPATGPWLITASDAGGFASVQFLVPAAGGALVAQGTVGSGGGGTVVCDPGNVVCALGNVPAQIAGEVAKMLGALFLPGQGTKDAFDALEAAMYAHEPLATIVVVKDKIAAVTGAASSSSRSCLDLDLHMVPLRPGVATPIQVCWSVLTSVAGWSTVRTLMGAVVYGEAVLMVWGWVQGRPDTSGRLTYRDDIVAGEPT